MSLAAAASSQQPPPLLAQPVNDFAHVIDDGSARELDRRIRALLASTGDVVVVATVQTFKPYADINEYAVKMFENGGKGIGERNKKNGALIVAAIDDHAMRIEVGYDLEEFITDGFAGETIRTVIAPEFRNGRYGPGLLAGATRLINRIAERRGVTLQDVPREQPQVRQTQGFPLWPVIVIIILLMLFSRGGPGRGGRGRHWGVGPWSGWNSGVGPFGGGGFGGGFGGFGGGSGGGGGGFGGFGGGSSGGGGASGSW